ncbi:MAG: hypothetical protein DSY97_05235, partial [SAR324 cluster bacterium]
LYSASPGMANGKNRKKQNYCSREVYFLNNGLKRQKYRAFVLFQETPCSLLHQLNNYLLILLKSSIFQQVQNILNITRPREQIFQFPKLLIIVTQIQFDCFLE